jgi:hypothetical protein
MGKEYHNKSGTFKTPRNPYEKERLDYEYIFIFNIICHLF